MSALIHIAPAKGPLLSEEVRKRRVYIETYGCQMNVSDTELMQGVLREAGFRAAMTPEDADVVLLNTCAIREHAEDRVLGRLSQLRHLKIRRPEVVLGVCGCMAKHLAEDLLDRVPYVDMVLGPDSYRRLPEIVSEAGGEPLLDVRLDRDEAYTGLDPVRRGGTNAWITIMRGCDKFCTFCIVPYVRGRERSIRADEVLRQVEVAAAEGFREVTLLGQTVNSYHDGEHDFGDLLKRVATVVGIRRIRFTSPHPSDFDDRLIETIAGEPKVCRFIHLPVQSGSDRVLEAMQRSYTSADYRALVGRLRDAMPGLALSTDVIVGFPGETEDDFGMTLRLVEEVGYDSAFMFKYSDREGTAAHRLLPDSVRDAEKGERLERLIALQNGISERINRTYVGRRVEVLVDGPGRLPGQMAGRTDTHKRVAFASPSARPNDFVHARVTSATLKALVGEVEGDGRPEGAGWGA